MNGHSSFPPIHFNRAARNMVAPAANLESLFLLTPLFGWNGAPVYFYFQAEVVDCVEAAAIGLLKKFKAG